MCKQEQVHEQQEHQNKITSNKLFIQILHVISKELVSSGSAARGTSQNFI